MSCVILIHGYKRVSVLIFFKCARVMLCVLLFLASFPMERKCYLTEIFFFLSPLSNQFDPIAFQFSDPHKRVQTVSSLSFLFQRNLHLFCEIPREGGRDTGKCLQRLERKEMRTSTKGTSKEEVHRGEKEWIK